MSTERNRWLGGYIRPGSRGPTFIIERWMHGFHFHVSTRRRTERAALKELERFELDPHGYRAILESDRPLRITEELLALYRQHLLVVKRDSHTWVTDTIRLLRYWATDLANLPDLRRLRTAELRRVLETRKTSRRHRIEAIKGFCRWLREHRELLAINEDPSLSLKVPQAEPALQHRRRAIPVAFIYLVLPHLPPETRDVAILLTGTAWHVSEARRFASAGEIVRPGDPLAVLVTRHKSGDLTRTPLVLEEHLVAAERLRARGRIPNRETLVLHLRRACEAVRLQQACAGTPTAELMPHWRLGILRHTVLTYAVQQGATPAEAAQFANHRSPLTTKRFYLDLAIPTVQIPVIHPTG